MGRSSQVVKTSRLGRKDAMVRGEFVRLIPFRLRVYVGGGVTSEYAEERSGDAVARPYERMKCPGGRGNPRGSLGVPGGR